MGTKTLHVGFVMDPIREISPHKDSTLALMIEAQKRGWSLFYMEVGDLFLHSGQAMARTTAIQVFDSKTKWFEMGVSEIIKLSELDVLFMRKDPPVDMNYINTTHLLDRAASEGLKVVNDPTALRSFNEKLFATEFPEFTPPSLVSSSQEQLLSFIEEQREVVLKPLNLMGGREIFATRLGDPNLRVMIEMLTNRGNNFIEAQRFVPEIGRKGDKRILLIYGKVVPYAFTRIPQKGDHRGNMAVGASAEGALLNDHERVICEKLGPVLNARGIQFAGIDVIGEFLTEINITSPTGIREIDRFHGCNLAADFMDALWYDLTHISYERSQ